MGNKRNTRSKSYNTSPPPKQFSSASSSKEEEAKNIHKLNNNNKQKQKVSQTENNSSAIKTDESIIEDTYSTLFSNPPKTSSSNSTSTLSSVTSLHTVNILRTDDHNKKILCDDQKTNQNEDDSKLQPILIPICDSYEIAAPAAFILGPKTHFDKKKSFVEKFFSHAIVQLVILQKRTIKKVDYIVAIFLCSEDIKTAYTQTDIKNHTIQVIDIPLNLKATSVHARFKRYGNITCLTMRTRGMFQYAFIKYPSSDCITHFKTNMWSDTFGYDIVKVLPLSLSQEERKKRQLYCFKLTGLPPNTQVLNIVKYIASIALTAQINEFRASLQFLHKIINEFANNIKALKSKIISFQSTTSSLSSQNKGHPNKRPHLTSSSDDNSLSDQDHISNLESRLLELMKTLANMNNSLFIIADSQLGSGGSNMSNNRKEIEDVQNYVINLLLQADQSNYKVILMASRIDTIWISNNFILDTLSSNNFAIPYFNTDHQAVYFSCITSDIIIKAAINHIDNHKSSILPKQDIIPNDILEIKEDISFLNKALKRSSRNINSSFSYLFQGWHIDRFVLKIIKDKYDFPLNLPSFIDSTNIKSLKLNLFTFRKTLYNLLDLKFKFHQDNLIKQFVCQRCDDYNNDKGHMLNFFLNQKKCSIVINRILINENNQDVLITNLIRIKEITNDHFQKCPDGRHEHKTIPNEYITTYKPIESINHDIYKDLISLPIKEEWFDIIQSLPKGKAPGPSKISNVTILRTQNVEPFMEIHLINFCFQPYFEPLRIINEVIQDVKDSKQKLWILS
ncbi:hypothetical protein C1645_824627 [Glomus cerebriforme]|uniref:Uncharacterized protein n=1 Tax=Glomus cerebriforme TaxID=658196 RepID=A0A397SVB7_9GLOM|nr:hypothetical protein C1645_824627 [Glomus cerebriforme]